MSFFSGQQRLDQTLSRSSVTDESGTTVTVEEISLASVLEKQCTDASWEPRLHEQGQGSPTPVNLLPRRPTFFIGVSKFSTYSARLLPSGMIFLYQPSFKLSSIVLRYPIRQTSV
jgi:hypothetical protein